MTLSNNFVTLFKKNLTLADFNIDFIGYDKGGYIVMETIKRLKNVGCTLFNGSAEIESITPRLIGLYAPVKSHFHTASCWFNEIQQTLKSQENDNIVNDDRDMIDTKEIVVAYGDPKIYKREMFEIYDIDTEHKRYFKASHGAMGCSPDGCKVLHWMAQSDDAFNTDIHIDHDTEIAGCISADEYIRNEAIKAGLPITPAGENFYDRFQT